MVDATFFNNTRHVVTNTAQTDFAFGSVPAGWQGLSSAGAVDGQMVPYEVRDGNNWENGYSVLSGSLTAGTRVVHQSSAGGTTKISLSGTATFTVVMVADWLNNIAALDKIPAAKSSGFTVAAGDRDTLFLCTGTFTAAFTAAATLGSKFKCRFLNTGSGVITLDPNSSELIDGNATAVLIPGESALIECDGSAFYTTGHRSHVRYDVAQALSAVQQQQARLNIAAAPFEAMAYNGVQVNGGMDVSQENGTTSVSLVNGTQKYVVDGWQAKFSSSSLVMNAQQVTPPGLPFFGAAFPKCLQLKATTGAALGSGDFTFLQQYVEGTRIARLGWGTSAAQPITLGFWVYATITGTAAITLFNAAANRRYIATYTVNSALTWEYKTVTIPGDTTGTWVTDSTIGLQIWFTFGVGSTLQGTAGAWGTTVVIGTSASTNFFASNNNVVCLTGVLVVAGSDLPNAANSLNTMRPFDQELLLAKRYWWNVKDPSANVYIAVGANGATTQAFFTFIYPVEMRAAPTLAVLNTTHFSCLDMAGSSAAATSIATTGSVGLKSVGVLVTVASGLTQGRGTMLFSTNADADLQFNARL